MRIIKRIIFLFATVALLSGCSTQVKNPEWVINEVMVVNETNFVDDFGQRHGWIEIYNNTAKTMDLGGRFRPTTETTRRSIRFHGVMSSHASNPISMPCSGPMAILSIHLPPQLELDPTKDNWIGLYDNDGKKLLMKSSSLPVCWLINIWLCTGRHQIQ